MRMLSGLLNILLDRTERHLRSVFVTNICTFVLAICFAAPALAETPSERWDREAALSAQALRAGKFDEAGKHGREALAAAEAAVGKDHLDYAIALNNLAAVYAAAGKDSEAIQLLVQVSELFEKHHGPRHVKTAVALDNLAYAYIRAGRLDEAQKLIERSLESLRKAHGNQHQDVAVALNNLAYVHAQRRDYAKAEQLFRESLAIQRKLHGNAHPEIAVSLFNLGAMLVTRQNYREAKPLLEDAVKIFRDGKATDHRDYPRLLLSLARANWGLGLYKAADDAYSEAIQLLEKQLGAGHTSVAAARRQQKELQERARGERSR